MFKHERLEERYIGQMLIKIEIFKISIRKMNFKSKLSLGIQKVAIIKGTLSEYAISMNLNATNNIIIICIKQKFTEL